MQSVVEIAMQLIEIDTTSGNESAVVDYVECFLQPPGFSCRRVPIDRQGLSFHAAYSPGNYSYEGRDSAIFTLPGTTGTRNLLFNAHADVVPAGSKARWKRPPFAPYVEGDKLFGRGAADTKGGLAGLLTAVVELRDSGWSPDYNLIIEITSDEETGGNGTLACLLEGGRIDAAVFIEPFGSGTICIGHRGALWFSVTTTAEGVELQNRGKPGSIEAMATAVAAIGEYARKRAALASHPDYARFDNARPVYIGRIEGGDWFSSPALSCRLQGVIGWLPDEAEEHIKDGFRNHLTQAFVQEGLPPPLVEYPHLHVKPSKTEPNDAIVRRLGEVITGVTSRPPAILCANSGTDMWIRRIYGETPCVVFGPGGGNCHGPNEYVRTDELEKCRKIFQELLRTW